MCAGGQDIPVTLRVDGGIEDGQWKSANDVLDTPAPQEDVQVTEATETEVMEPSAPLYKPVIERIDKLSERLPEKVAEETFEEVSPMMQHGFQMADRNQMNTMQMLDRIMRNTRPRKRFPPRGDGPLGKGGGRNDPRVPRPRYQNLGATPQVAGLVGLLAKPQEPTYNKRTLGDPNIGPMNFPKQQGATPMQPEVIEEQQQMEILGQPKQFAGGGIVNALMATPIGQAELRKYATGGEIKFGDYIFDYGPTGDDPLDILRGRIYDDGRKARFFSSEAHMKDPSEPVVNWGRKDIVEQITEDLTPQRRKKKKEEPHEGDSQVTGHEPEMDPVTGVEVGKLSEIDYDPAHFKDYPEMPTIPTLWGLGLKLAHELGRPPEYKEPPNFWDGEPTYDPNKPVTVWSPLGPVSVPKKHTYYGPGYKPKEARAPIPDKYTKYGMIPGEREAAEKSPGFKSEYGMGIGSEEDDPNAWGYGDEGGRPEDAKSLKSVADYEKAYQEMVDKSKTGTKTEPTLPSPHLTLDAGKKTTIDPPKSLTQPPTKTTSGKSSKSSAPSKGLASIGLDYAPGKYKAYDPTAILGNITGPLLGVQGREVARKLDQAYKNAIKNDTIYNPQKNPNIAIVTPGAGGYDHMSVRGGLTEAAHANAFGHTPSGYWSQTDDEGVMGGGLTDEQITDIESQIDTFDEIGGAGGIGQSEDGQEWGE